MRNSIKNLMSQWGGFEGATRTQMPVRTKRYNVNQFSLCYKSVLLIQTKLRNKF
jgi:hypothetical protein